MKNEKLIKRLHSVKQEKSIEIIEGFVLTSLKGGDGCASKTRCEKTKCETYTVTAG